MCPTPGTSCPRGTAGPLPRSTWPNVTCYGARFLLLPLRDGSAGEIPSSWGRMAAGSQAKAGCVAAEGSVQPVAIIGHAGSTQTLNCGVRLKSACRITNRLHVNILGHITAVFSGWIPGWLGEQHSSPSFRCTSLLLRNGLAG